MVKEKASDFFSPFQFSVACPRGSENINHNVREVFEQHWSDADVFQIRNSSIPKSTTPNLEILEVPNGTS